MPNHAYRVVGLFRYPLKSAAGVSCREVELDRFGVRDDRRWMIIDAAGAPVTLREAPRLARLRARVAPGGLLLEWGNDAARTLVEWPAPGSPRIPIRIWNDTVRLPQADDAANDWLGERLGREARLVWMPDDVERPVNPRYAGPDDRTSLTDGYPLHIVGSGSMADLNARLEHPIGVDRFRPNVYVEGPPAFDEDTWGEVRIGESLLRVVKPCPRCAVTTVDPATGERGREPLRTLSAYRKREGGVMFGQNALHEGTGRLRVGDAVVVVSRRDAPAA